MKGVHFSWNKQFNLNPEKKYLVYYRGCFCPPTKGHFSVVEKWSQYENVIVYVSQIGSQDRHGVPYKTNKRIWKLFLKEGGLSEAQQSRVILKRLRNANDIEPYLDDIHAVIFVRGNEKQHLMKTNTEKGETSREKEYLDKQRRAYELQFQKTQPGLLQLMKQYKKPLMFTFDDRTEMKRLSATQMVKAVKREKSKKDENSYQTLKPFLPTNLSDETIKQIWKMLSKCTLH